MAKKRSLEYLRPVSGKHSIQETIFTVYLSPDTPISNPEGFRKLHTKKIKKTFPKLDILLRSGAVFRANLNLGQADITKISAPQPIGFSFESYFPDGNLKMRLLGENGELPRPWLAVNLLEYPGWDRAVAFAQRWLRVISNHDRSLVVRSIGLHYIDHLNWESTEAPDLRRIFNLNSRFLPSRLSENVEGWSAKMGYNFPQGENRQIDNIEIYVQPIPQTGHRRFVINTPLRLDLGQHVPLRRLLNNTKKGGFKDLVSGLHDHDKVYLSDILSKEVTKMIGLK